MELDKRVWECYERTEDQAKENVSFSLDYQFHHFLKKNPTPIEQIMYLALWGYQPYPIRDLRFQEQIGDYRVDFLALPAVESNKKIVIECDGHNFHERTKEQAQRDKKRDRDLQSSGYSVFRFTGSELWRDPEKCANEISDVLMSRSVKNGNE